MYKFLIIGSLIAALAGTVANANANANVTGSGCSIHPAKDATDKQLAALAKVSQADAEKKALSRAKSPAKVVGSELQVEDTCLVWVLIVKESGKSGVQQSRVDAGTGKVLKPNHESGK